MTAATTWDERAPATRASAAHFVWIAFAVLAVASFAVPDGTIPSWLKEIPPPWRLGLDTAISSFMKWLVEDATFGLFTFRDATRAVAFLNVPLTAATAIFSTGPCAEAARRRCSSRRHCLGSPWLGSWRRLVIASGHPPCAPRWKRLPLPRRVRPGQAP